MVFMSHGAANVIANSILLIDFHKGGEILLLEIEVLDEFEGRFVVLFG